MSNYITQDRLKEILAYDSNTGVFTWNANVSNIKRGNEAGYRSKRGYVFIKADKHLYLAHRLAWMYMTGKFPDEKIDIDHINQVKFDNRFSNLRLASRSENQRNVVRYSNNTTGFKGVSFHKQSGKYKAYIKHNYQSKHLGVFDSPEEASSAYTAAARLTQGKFMPGGIQK